MGAKVQRVRHMAQVEKIDAPMTAAAFMAWQEAQSSGRRYELLDGIVYEMQAERLVHIRVKSRVHKLLEHEIAKGGLSCEAIADGMAVKVTENIVFEPDVLVRCGETLPGATLLLTDPMIVIEIVSPTSQRIDVLRKFARYFLNPSIIHYLIIIPAEKSAIHHRRLTDGQIVSLPNETGLVKLDPPGLVLDLAEVMAVAE